MAGRVTPFVYQILAARSCEVDLLDETWLIRDPLVASFLPQGVGFPFREARICIFVQLSGGLGAWECAIELRQKRDDGSYRFVGISKSTELNFEPTPRLVVKSTAFELRSVPFRREGLYEFRVLTRTSESFEPPTYQALEGPVAELRILDSRSVI